MLKLLQNILALLTAVRFEQEDIKQRLSKIEEAINGEPEDPAEADDLASDLKVQADKLESAINP